MIRTIVTAASLALAGAGVGTAVHFASIPSPPSAEDLYQRHLLESVQQQLEGWADKNERLIKAVESMADEVARQYSAMSKISNAIHDDLMRAEAERARARAADNAVTQRYHNDAAQFLKAVPR